MFNFGFERAWALLTAAGLIVFLAATPLLHFVLASAGLSVAFALVCRESLVLAVSTAFYLSYRFKTLSDANPGRAGVEAHALALSRTPIQSER